MGIVVLSLKISTVFNLGVPGILVSWPVVSINIWLIFLIGRWLFGTSHERMVLVLAAGACKETRNKKNYPDAHCSQLACVSSSSRPKKAMLAVVFHVQYTADTPCMLSPPKAELMHGRQ